METNFGFFRDFFNYLKNWTRSPGFDKTGAGGPDRSLLDPVKMIFHWYIILDGYHRREIFRRISSKNGHWTPLKFIFYPFLTNFEIKIQGLRYNIFFLFCFKILYFRISKALGSPILGDFLFFLPFEQTN